MEITNDFAFRNEGSSMKPGEQYEGLVRDFSFSGDTCWVELINTLEDVGNVYVVLGDWGEFGTIDLGDVIGIQMTSKNGDTWAARLTAIRTKHTETTVVEDDPFADN